MPKKTKTESTGAAAPVADTTPSTPPSTAVQSSAKKPAARKSAPRKAVSKKKPAAAKKGAGKADLKSKAPAEPSDADIRLRAYFIAERRVQLALQGDPANDWLAAKEELVQEARQGQS